MTTRRFLIGLTAAIASLAICAPLATAGDTIVDDYWRDQAAVTARPSDTIVDDYWRDGVALASPAPDTIVDDYWRYQPRPATPAPDTIVDDYFRDAPTAVGSPSGGFHWADFGIGIAVAVGAMLVLAGIGAGLLAVRQGRAARTHSAGTV